MILGSISLLCIIAILLLDLILLALPFAVAALVLGSVTLHRLKQNPDFVSRGMAIIGLVCGGITVLIFTWFFVLVICSH